MTTPNTLPYYLTGLIIIPFTEDNEFSFPGNSTVGLLYVHYTGWVMVNQVKLHCVTGSIKVNLNVLASSRQSNFCGNESLGFQLRWEVRTPLYILVTFSSNGENELTFNSMPARHCYTYPHYTPHLWLWICCTLRLWIRIRLKLCLIHKSQTIYVCRL